jgi:uncharacterized protein (TIGR02145 family)
MKKLVKTTLIIIFLTIIITSCEKEENPEIISCTTFELGGKQYETVQIGQQCWMAENLDFNAGAGCWEAPKPIAGYGRYYTWETAKRVCPAGWHIPTHNDWDELMQYISDQNGGYDKVVYDEDSFTWNGIAAHLKTRDVWIADQGTNNYGFSALPAGYRRIEPSTGEVVYSDYNSSGLWWSSSNDGTYPCHCFINEIDQDFTHFNTAAHLVNNGLSVRYIKD